MEADGLCIYSNGHDNPNQLRQNGLVSEYFKIPLRHCSHQGQKQQRIRHNHILQILEIKVSSAY
jgi:hypothetical protein